MVVPLFPLCHLSTPHLSSLLSLHFPPLFDTQSLFATFQISLALFLQVELVVYSLHSALFLFFSSCLLSLLFPFISSSSFTLFIYLLFTFNTLFIQRVHILLFSLLFLSLCCDFILRPSLTHKMNSSFLPFILDKFYTLCNPTERNRENWKDATLND